MRAPRRPRAPRSALRPARQRESTSADPQAPTYTLRDRAADAAALAGALGGRSAHLAGIGVGEMVAQVAVLNHPAVFSALTLVGPAWWPPARPTPTCPTLTGRR
ncbi:hypothetical protein [Streptomyces sp. WAC 01529]|uniref:hypothetical protein n=1 Tax=Streptomyces sp. WAC 01529 TaxID=2203205 RepID=UPI001F0C6704|nr:hypothetical protein [Streptomyces sp. WAC 01529]